MTETRRISDIKVGQRFRKDLGDLDILVESIQEIGLLHPIVINENNELIAGQRRLEVCKSLDWNEISVTIVPINDIIKGEFHENAVRKDFTVFERVAILEEIEKQRIGHRPGKGGKLPPFQEQQKGKKSRDIAARYTNVSPRQLSKEKKVIQKINEKPEKYDEIKQKLLQNKMTVHEAFKRIKKQEVKEELLAKARGPLSNKWIEYEYQSEKTGNTISVHKTEDDRCILINADFREFSPDSLYDRQSSTWYESIDSEKRRVIDSFKEDFDELDKFLARKDVSHNDKRTMLNSIRQRLEI